MKITELLKRNTVILNLKATSKSEVINELVNKLDEAGNLNNKEEYKKEILKREEKSTTGIGEGIAIPHAKTRAVKIPAICFGRSDVGVDYDSLDGEKANLFFMIAASEGASDTHIETLSRLSSFLMDGTFKDKLLKVKSIDELMKIIDEKENENPQKEPTEVSSGEKPLILAVTACPTGIAHTYMAADALKAKAKELGVDIKVETNGSTGVKNRLTDDEINRAVAIIVAADKNVEMNRFDGKHVIQTGVADGIRKAKELIESALKKDAPIFKGDGTKTSNSFNSPQESIGKQIYKHLMNGVSNMLPFVVGGGILIALSFWIGGINAEGPVAELLNKIGGAGAFRYLVPILAGYIAISIADRPGFMPGMVGGFLATQANAGFLGGLVAGFLAGYIVLGLKKVFDILPQALEGIKPVLLYPLFGLLITGILMEVVINPPLATLNGAITDFLNGLNGGNAIIFGLILGGMMAVDLGGPVNKAAFAFGIAAIDSGNFAIHAPVMAGGMVPPIGIALATTFFKSKFTEEERKSGLTNYIMGLSFITEGAIPFAAADPIRVLGSSIIGSAIAGALSMAFKITLPAPHGGLFVFGLVNKPVMYFLAILLGAIITALILGVWKKKVNYK